MISADCRQHPFVSYIIHCKTRLVNKKFMKSAHFSALSEKNSQNTSAIFRFGTNTPQSNTGAPPVDIRNAQPLTLKSKSRGQQSVKAGLCVDSHCLTVVFDVFGAIEAYQLRAAAANGDLDCGIQMQHSADAGRKLKLGTEFTLAAAYLLHFGEITLFEEFCRRCGCAVRSCFGGLARLGHRESRDLARGADIDQHRAVGEAIDLNSAELLGLAAPPERSLHAKSSLAAALAASRETAASADPTGETETAISGKISSSLPFEKSSLSSTNSASPPSSSEMSPFSTAAETSLRWL